MIYLDIINHGIIFFWGSLVGTQEKHSNFDNFSSKKAFLIILFVAFREFFVAH